jgi:hypothetical protein
MAYAVATFWLPGLLARDVAPSQAELTPAVRSHIRVPCDSVPHPRPFDAFLDKALCHLAPMYDENYQRCGTFFLLPPLPDGTGVCQPLYVGGDHYTLIRRFELSSHLVQAFPAFPYVPYERDFVHHYQFPGLILFDVHDSCIDHPCCWEDVVEVLQSHLCNRIRVRDSSNCNLGIPLGVDDPNGAGAFWWKTTELIADAISWSI